MTDKTPSRSIRHRIVPLLMALAGAAPLPAAARTYDTITVKGAQFIPAEDIKATCGAVPGLEYSAADMAAIQSCLMKTDVFRSVRVAPEGDTMVITVSELNDRPGRIEGGLAYVAQDGLTAQLTFERYNLLPGTYGYLNLDYSGVAKRLATGLYRADAIGDQLDLGVDLFADDTHYDDQKYRERSTRIEPYIAWTPTKKMRIEAALGYRSYEMTSPDADISPILLRESWGTVDAPYLRFAWQGSTMQGEGVNQRGVSLRLDEYLWNIGTDDPLSDIRVNAQARLPLPGQVQFLAGLRGGSVTGMDGNSPRAIDRFFPGADTFRGFAPRGIGPKDGGDFLGGDHYMVASLEVQRDLGMMKDHNLRAGLFLDTGSVWGLSDDDGGRIDDGWHLRSSVGISLTVDFGRVPVSLYLAQPISDQPGDKDQPFGISISATF